MEYRFYYQEPHKHFVSIELRVENISEKTTYIQLPAWRPGRYELQNFARNIQKFEITDKKGTKIPFKKISRERWEVDTLSSKEILIKYNYYCTQMDAGGCWLNEDQLYLNFICCSVYVLGRENEACSVSLDIPLNYQIACGLPQKNQTLFAENFHQLVDSPMIASATLQHQSYEVGGINFHIWFLGNIKPHWDTITKDFKKFTEENFAVFGEFPEKEYHFLNQILPYPHYHGVEHRNSTVITLGPAEDFDLLSMYENLLGISCHELFHTWNALKIRPKELLPYDFTKENYFRTGYVIEGITTYYGDLLLARSGVFSTEQYFKELDETFKRYFENFGHQNLSVADSSFDLWIDGYVAGIPNRKVSIYIKGAIAALILDLEIRKETKNKKSLDDVMRLLWEKFGKHNIGYSESDYEKIIESVIGKSYNEYFENYIYGITPIEERLSKALSFVGCQLSISSNPVNSERLFGFRTVQKNNRTFVDLIEPNSVGDKIFTKDDELISVDSFNIENNFQELLYKKESVEIIFRRFGKTIQTTITKGEKEFLPIYRIRRKENATDEEITNFKCWLRK